MSKVTSFLFVLAIGISITIPATASTVSLDPNQFAVLSGGTFNTGHDVNIKGWAGGVGNSYFGQSSTLQGNLYTNGTFGIDHKVNIAGSIFAAKDVYLNDQSTTGSLQGLANVGLGRQVSVNGDLMAGKAMNINSSSKIHGNVDYGSSYWADKSAKIDGKVLKDTSGLDSWKFNMRDTPSAWSAGSGSLYYKAKSDKTLSPGDYGSLSVDQSSIIRLSAGTYNFSSVYLGKFTQLIADTSKGNVVVNILGDLNTDSSVTLGQDGSQGLLAFNNKGNLYLGQSTVANANFFNYGGSLTIDHKSVINGSLYSAGNVYLGNRVTVDGSSANPVPEPATLLLLTLGGLTFFKARKAH